MGDSKEQTGKESGGDSSSIDDHHLPFLERLPGTGPDGPQARNVELPFCSFSNDIFFSSSSFSARVRGQDLDQILSSNGVRPEASGAVDTDHVSKPLIRPFTCQCELDCKDPAAPVFTASGTIYRELPHKNTIRILEVLQGNYADPVVCKLHVTSLPEAVQSYSALSYCWQVDNTAQPPEAVLCNGREILIGKNLFDAIRRIRQSTASQLIWADALCINQNDVDERSMQVSKMKDIFRSAHQVLAWLGEEILPTWEHWPLSASMAFSDLCTVVNAWRDKSGRSSWIPEATYWSPDDSQACQESSHYTRDPGYWWQETLRLFERRWFHRVWVIQEVALASSARLLLGQYAISWEVVGLAAAILRTNFNQLVPTIGQHYTREKLVNFRTGVMNAYFMYRLSRCQSYVERITADFNELLILTRSFDCQDDRDRIYGLLGLPFRRRLSSPDSPPFLLPDYSKTTTEVYREVAEKILQDSESLRLLSSVQRPSPTAWDYDLKPFDIDAPSWVPQWGFTETQSLSPFERRYHPTTPHHSFVRLIPTLSPPRLLVRGIDFTTASKVSTVSSSSDFCIPWWVLKKNQNLNVCGWADGGLVRYPLEPTGNITDDMLSRNITRQSLTETAMILTAGKDWYGAPVADKAAHLADYAKLLLEGGLLWCLEDDAFGSDRAPLPEQESRSKYDYRRTISDAQFQQLSAGVSNMAQNGTAARFLDAAGTVGSSRRRFTTGSGLRGIGPGAMQPGDRICVIQGANLPLVLRHREGRYEVIGECYVYLSGLVEGETAQQAIQRTSGVEEKWIELV